VVAKQNPPTKSMEPAQIINYKDLLLSKYFKSGLCLKYVLVVMSCD